MRYLLGIFLGNITFIAVAKVLVQSPKTSVSIFTVEWLGLIFLSFIGVLLVYRSAGNKFQEDKGMKATMHV